MSNQSNFPDPVEMNRMSRAASTLGYEIVDIAGFLDVVEAKGQEQRQALHALSTSARAVMEANQSSQLAIDRLTERSDQTYEDVQTSAEMMRKAGTNTRDVAQWVQDIESRTTTVSETLRAVKKNNSQIASISMQVNTLAINAKIEAARAGESGRGFAVVAEAINELSQHTKAAAAQISTNIEALTDWISSLGQEARDVAGMASDVLEQSKQTDQALGRMEHSVRDTHEQAQHIAEHATSMGRTLQVFEPKLNSIEETVRVTVAGIEETHKRIENLIDTSETIVQSSTALGGVTTDIRFIEHVQMSARLASAAIEAEIDAGRVSHAAMFDTVYRPIEGSDPVQVITGFTATMDRVMPQFQEAALDFDPKVVFCAAVDTNGYLPTHNKKFSHPQGDDALWNTANCRNRRIFDDRVGLKAGRNTAPFLLQVYRRDMGGGKFVMMKDLSAPITIKGQHWGGLRFAYTF